MRAKPQIDRFFSLLRGLPQTIWPQVFRNNQAVQCTVQQGVNQCMIGRTCLLVTQRLKIVEKCQQFTENANFRQSTGQQWAHFSGMAKALVVVLLLVRIVFQPDLCYGHNQFPEWIHCINQYNEIDYRRVSVVGILGTTSRGVIVPGASSVEWSRPQKTLATRHSIEVNSESVFNCIFNTLQVRVASSSSSPPRLLLLHFTIQVIHLVSAHFPCN